MIFATFVDSSSAHHQRGCRSASRSFAVRPSSERVVTASCRPRRRLAAAAAEWDSKVRLRPS